MKGSFRNEYGLDRFGTIKCICGSTIRLNKDEAIKVNIESDGEVDVPGLWIVSNHCNNALCKWSNVDRKEFITK